MNPSDRDRIPPLRHRARHPPPPAPPPSRDGSLAKLGLDASSVPDSHAALAAVTRANRPRLRICLASDFFFPNIGGIESHLYCLAQELILRGHKVIILTHTYPNRTKPSPHLPNTRVGVRWLTNGLKAYYIPVVTFSSQATLPALFGSLALFRDIVIRERIDIVHGHQAFSATCLESILHARTMGLATCFTDHSLFGFKDVGAIAINKVLKFVLSDVDHVICVSHTSRENTVLRASLVPQYVSVIPNAVIADEFTPDPTKVDARFVTIVSVTRLVYNKGADLLAQVIPIVCAQYPHVRFLIAGDGAKRVDLEQMREKHILQDRVTLLGAIPHGRAVRDTLVQGQIFLNTSLTEAFGTAMIEAACAGLHIVSTRVGGVPELLPDDLITFSAQAHPMDLAHALGLAIERVAVDGFDPWATHARVRDMYSWSDVARRTERVYYGILNRSKPDWLHRLALYRTGGPVAGLLFCFVAAVDVMLVTLLEWWRPREEVDVAPEFDVQGWRERRGELLSEDRKAER